MSALPWPAYWQGIAANVWNTNTEDLAWFGDVPTMLSPGEVRMLAWLTAQYPAWPSRQPALDLGPFLGGSTRALAQGLLTRPAPHPLLHSYDMFRVPQDAYVHSLLPEARPVGASVLDLYHDQIAPVSAVVATHAGDFLTATLPPGPYPLVFVDLAKTWALNQRLVADVFTQLVPGQSVLIQQDYNDQGSAHLHVTMAYYADHFVHLTDEGASRVYGCRKPVHPADVVTLAALPYPEKRRLSAQAQAATNPVSAFFIAVATGWLVFEAEGLAAALIYLDTLAPRGLVQPWLSETPYVATVAQAMRALGDTAGKAHYHATYFGA